MKLTFFNSQGYERELGIFKTREEAERAIFDFTHEHSFEVCYLKLSLFPSKTVYDVGSWSEFFVLYDNDDIETNKYGVWEEIK